MTSFDLTLKPIRNEDVVWREDEEDIFICSADGELIFSISDVGADIWLACDGQLTISDITELLIAAYDIDQETLAKDLVEFLLEMKAKDLVSFL